MTAVRVIRPNKKAQNNALERTRRGGVPASRAIVRVPPCRSTQCSRDAARRIAPPYLLSSLLASLVVGCASAPGVFTEIEIGYPKADSARCVSLPGEEMLEVLVHDSSGGILPGAAVYLAPLSTGNEAAAPPALTSVAGSDGVAAIRLHGRGAFAITAVLGGFLASARTVEVGEGCVARVKVQLLLAVAGGR